MNIKVRKVREGALIPVRASSGAVGYDVFASCVLDKNTKDFSKDLPVEILSGQSVLIGIGVQMAVPWPYQCEVRPRSGLANKFDVELSNSPGTIDPDFRGEAGVLLRNRGEKAFVVESNMRIAQLIFSQVAVPVLEEAKTLPSTRRGAGGFGSTGLFGKGFGVDDYEAIVREKDEYYMGMTLSAAERSRCVRGVKFTDGRCERNTKGKLVGQTRKFGCIIVKGERVISQGYNAQYLGSERCEDVGCLREELNVPSGTKIEICRAMHAEWWAITNLSADGGGDTRGATMYINAEPCKICAKIITGLGLETVVMLEGVYPDNGVEILRDASINIRYVKM